MTSIIENKFKFIQDWYITGTILLLQQKIKNIEKKKHI